MSLDERSFFSDKNESRPARYACPRCNRTNEYSVRWVRRSKKDRIPPGADERDRAKFAKLRDHLIRVDDEVVCKTCGKKFEIPSMHSLLFTDQLEGLPKDEEEEGSGAASAAPSGSGETPSSGGVSASAEASADKSAPPAQKTSETGPADRDGNVGGSKDRPLPKRFSTPSRGWKG